MTRPFVKNILMLSAFCASITRVFSVDLTVTPSTATNDYVGKIVLAVTGMTPGTASRIELFFDLNANGLIDVGDALARSFLVIDGAEPTSFNDGPTRVRNWNIPADEDGSANGQIRVELLYPGVDRVIDSISGAHVFKVSDPANGFAPVTRPFTTRQKTLPQGVTGRITVAGTGTPLANAPVFLVPPDGSPVAGAFTDASGNYTLYSPPGGFVVIPMMPGFVADSRAGMTLVQSGLATLNLSVPAATRTISGKLQDRASGAGIPGVLLLAQSSTGQISTRISDSDGNFVITVLAGEWEINPEGGALAPLGYVGFGDSAKVVVSTMTGNVSNVILPVAKADALIYGTLKNSQNQPIVGLQIWARESSGLFKANGLSFASAGNFCLGVVAGSWFLQPDEEASAALGYSSQSTTATVGVNRAFPVGISMHRVSAHLRGRLVGADGMPVGDMRIGVSDHGASWVSTQTDGNGQFDIGVSAGAWYLQLETNQAQERFLMGPDLPVFNVADGVDRNNILVTTLRVTAKISGSVKSNSGSPIEGMGVGGSTTVNGTKYSEWTTTDSLGNYRLRTFNGTWQLDLDCNGLQALGYGCQPAAQALVTGGDATHNFVVVSTSPLKIDSSSLANGKLGTAYRLQLFASGGEPPYQWALAVGSASLPPGLSLSSDGFLSGVPVASGSFNFILNLRDGALTSVSQAFGITITGQATLSVPVRHSSSQFRMNLNGDAGQNYTLQFSDTLAAWTTLLITNAPGASFQLTDPNATNSARFYRVLVGP